MVRQPVPGHPTIEVAAVIRALLRRRTTLSAGAIRPLGRGDIQARSGHGEGGGAVEVHVHHLRRKLGEDIIQTLRGVGYRVPPEAGD